MSSLRSAAAGSLAVVCTAALLLSGCASGSDAKGATAPPDTAAPAGPVNSASGPADATQVADGGLLVFGLEAEPEGLDPTRYAFSSSGHTIASAVFDPLATLDADGNPVPYLATSIDGSDNFKTWTIGVPTGVTFHNGTKLTAQVVAGDFEAYRQSIITKLAWQKVTEVKVTDDTHVVVTFSEPFAAFPALLTTQTGYVFAPEMLTNTDLVNKPVGTGPFVFDAHTKDEIWSFKKNPSYWRKGLPHLNAIEFKPIPDDSKRASELLSGDLDVIHTNRPDQLVQLRSSDVKRVENPVGEEDYLMLNTQAAPFDNLLARQAVAYATNAARWRHDQQHDIEQPANGPFAPGQLGYVADNGFPQYDLEKAKALVKQYEAQTGKPLEFQYMSQASLYDDADTQSFTADWMAAGMKVTTQSFPQINLVANVASGHYQAGRFRLFSAQNPDVDSEQFWRSSSVVAPPNVSLNFPRLIDPTIDAAIEKALGSTDPKVRDEAYQTVSREFATALPYIWLGRPVWMLAANPKVNGIYAAKNGSVQTIGAKTWLADLWIG